MAIDFSKFDAQVDVNQLTHDVEEAVKNGGGDFPTIEEGVYICEVENLEIGTTKDGRPMLKGMFRIVEGEYKKSCLFYNRVLFGTKNDANMIASAVGFIKSLEPSEDVGPIVFQNYSQFADLVLDVAEDIADLTYEVEYDPDAFNSIHIADVFE